MAIKSADQITIVDLTDGYSLGMTSEAYTFIGDTQYALAGSCTTQVVCYQGDTAVPVTIGTCTCPTGVTATVTNNGTNTPTITIAVAANKVSGSCEVTIPVTVGDDIEFTRKFSIGVALKGATGATGATGAKGDKGDKGDTGKGITATRTYYKLSSSATAPTFSASSFTDSANTATTSSNPYLWACTVITYTDNTTTNTGVYLASKYVTNGQNGQNGTSVTVSSIKYAIGSSATTKPTSFTATSPVATTAANPYLWTEVTYSDGSKAYSVSAKGDTGAAGADAITMVITSSNGTVFKNGSISTTLTAHVYKAGKELTASTSPTLASQGTIKWYKNGGSTAVGTGQSLTITGEDVDSKATYTAQLEG